jgi:RNA polymerase sigma factor (sigma-70 family)
LRAVAPDHAERFGEREMLDQALAQLSRADAACLLLRFQQGLKYSELAVALGVSIPAARMRLSRARVAFRESYLRLSQEESA